MKIKERTEELAESLTRQLGETWEAKSCPGMFGNYWAAVCGPLRISIKGPEASPSFLVTALGCESDAIAETPYGALQILYVKLLREREENDARLSSVIEICKYPK